MAGSVTEICNSALIKVGAERAIDIDLDNTKESKLCREQYPKLRDEVLRSHPWNFAIKRAELAQDIVAPVFDYTIQYPLPQDCLRVLKTDLDDDSNWAIEGRMLLTDTSTMKIKYVAKITDVSLFDANFAEALALRMAADLAYPLVQSTALMEKMFAAYKLFLGTSRSFDAQEGFDENRVVANEWTNSRF